MASIYLSGVLPIILGVALPRPAEAQLGKIGPIGPAAGPIIGAIVGTAAAAVVATVVVIHYSKKRTITGCVVSVPNGMTITNEKDKQTYTLSGDITAIKPGDRLKLQGKKRRLGDTNKTLDWEARKVVKDFGVCQLQP